MTNDYLRIRYLVDEWINGSKKYTKFQLQLMIDASDMTREERETLNDAIVFYAKAPGYDE